MQSKGSSCRDQAEAKAESGRRKGNVIPRLVATRAIRPGQSGRPRPLIVECVRTGGSTVEVICKISDGCDEGVNSWAKELVTAMVAGRLHLSVPEPFAVELPSERAHTRLRLTVSFRLTGGSSL